MKKQLLLAMSAMSAMAFGAAPDLNAPGKDLTRVFNNNQTGALLVRGRLSSVAPLAKYVIFATPDGKQMEDILNLKSYTMRSTGRSGFEGTNNYVKVQKIVGGVGQNLTNESTTFKVINYGLNGPALANYAITEGKSGTVMPYQLLAKADLDAVAAAVTKANPTGKNTKYTADNGGEIKDQTGAVYSPNGTIVFEQKEKGILRVTNGNQYVPKNMIKDDKVLKAFDTAFANEKQFGEIWIKVTVK